MAGEVIGYALVGCGRFGRVLHVALQGDEGHPSGGGGRTRIRPWPGRRRRSSASCRWPACRRSWTGKDVDIVHIATPAGHARGPVATAALEAGKHVLCEKPLAITGSEAQRVAASSLKAGRKVTVNFILRHSPDRGDGAADYWGWGCWAVRCGAYFENYAPGRGASAQPLVLGSVLERRDLRRARRTLLRPVPPVVRGRGGSDGRNTSPGRVRTSRDRAFCAIEFADMLVTHYHGFDQPIRPRSAASHDPL